MGELLYVESTCHQNIYIFLSLGGCKIVNCCNSNSGIRRSKAIVNIHIFTVRACKIQTVYCGHYCLGGMRIRLSISEMNMRIVTLQDLQTLTSEGGNNFFFTSTLGGRECSASRLFLFIRYEKKYGSCSIH